MADDDIPLKIVDSYSFGRETMSPALQRVVDEWLRQEGGNVSAFGSYIDRPSKLPVLPWRDSE
jgi:hypothetical protein